MTKTHSYLLNEKVYSVKSIYMGDLVRLVLVGETSEKFLNCFYNCEMPWTFGDCYMSLVHPREILGFIEDIHDELKATGLTNRNVSDVCAVVEDCVKQKILTAGLPFQHPLQPSDAALSHRSTALRAIAPGHFVRCHLYDDLIRTPAETQE